MESLTPTASRAASPSICLQAIALKGFHLKIKTVLLLFVKRKEKVNDLKPLGSERKGWMMSVLTCQAHVTV